MRWVGIPGIAGVYQYKKTWSEWRETPSGLVMVYHDNETTTVEFMEPVQYAIVVKGAENHEGYPLDLELSVLMQPKNAKDVLFGIKNSYNAVVTKITAEAAVFVKENDFAQLLSLRTVNAGTTLFSSRITAMNEEIAALGWRIVNAQIISVEFAGIAKEAIAKATVDAAIANQEMLAAKLRAQGKAAEAVELNKARVTFLQEIEKLSDPVKKIALAEAWFGKDSKLKTLVLGDNKTMLPLPEEGGDE